MNAKLQLKPRQRAPESHEALSTQGTQATQALSPCKIQHLLYSSRVRFVKTSIVVLLNLLWVLASNHCALEQITSLGFLSCLSSEGSHPDQNTGCEGDGCAVVENQVYKAEDVQVAAHAPLLMLASVLSPLLAKLTASETASHILPETAPPELSQVWQFSQRTALPPRAPSIAS